MSIDNMNLSMNDVVKLAGFKPLCKNCGERPPMENTPYCEVCRDEMEDFFNEMGKDNGQHDKYNER